MHISIGTNDFIDVNIIKKHILKSNYELNKYPISEYELLQDEIIRYWKNHVKLCKFKTKGIIKLETDDDETNGGDGLEKPFEWESIQFFVKDINGKSHIFVLPLSTTVKELKEKLEIKTGFKVEDQRLTCNGKTMENNKLLEYYGLQPNQTIMQITRLKGGN